MFLYVLHVLNALSKFIMREVGVHIVAHLK